jgi:hypothetical protein
MPSPYPAHKSFRVTAGVTFDYRFQYLDSASGAIDLTPYTASWTVSWVQGTTVYNNVPASSMPSQTGVVFGGDSGNPTNGTIDLVFSASDTATFPWTLATYDLRLVHTINGATFDLLTGAISIQPVSS